MRTLFAFACAVAFVQASVADTRPDAHAPIALMGDHMHQQGEFMFSYRYMHMAMQGNRDGGSRLSPAEVAGGISHPFADPPRIPPTLRVVPVEMTMDMHMIGVMYAPNDRVTLAGMGTYLEKQMDHLVFRGPRGTDVLGEFTTSTRGPGDVSLLALLRLSEGGARHRIHATVGTSVPVGSVTKTDEILTPANTRPSPRLPYPMQLGSGTVDLIVGATYASEAGAWGWGAQTRSVVRIGDNDEGYALGDEHWVHAWLSRVLTPQLSVSARIARYARSNISGLDDEIAAPVQTADPRRQKAQRLELALGSNLVLPGGRHRLAADVAVPVGQRLDGPQLESDWQVTVGWQFAR